MGFGIKQHLHGPQTYRSIEGAFAREQAAKSEAFSQHKQHKLR
jgi:hypothetical protein